MRAVVLFGVAILILSACAPPLDPMPAAPGAVDAVPAPSPTGLPETKPTQTIHLPSPETPQADPAVAAIIQKAKEMLADKLGIEPASIELFHLQAMDWPDESLGCPLGGQSYAQVITPGYLIELDAGSSIYVFHSDQAGRVLLCGLEPTREIFQGP